MGFDLKYINIPFVIDDVSTAGQVYVPINEEMAGTVVEIETVLNGAIGTANAGLTAKVNGAAVTGGAITIGYSGSAAGDIDNCAPTALNEVVDGDLLEIETNGASTNAVRVFGNVLIRR